MDELIPALFILIATVAGIVSNAKKEKKSREAIEHHKSTAAARVQAAQQKVKAQSAMPQTKPYVPQAQAARPAVVAPTVHTHLQPDCDVHDAQGSLNFASTEGKDPCHEDQLSGLRTEEPASVPQPGLTFDWTGDSMVKAVVMQEVLNRPVRRVR